MFNWDRLGCPIFPTISCQSCFFEMCLSLNIVSFVETRKKMLSIQNWRTIPSKDMAELHKPIQKPEQPEISQSRQILRPILIMKLFETEKFVSINQCKIFTISTKFLQFEFANFAIS